MTLRLGEVVLIRMQFHEATGAKVRPAVVLLDTGDSDFVAAPVTSHARNSEFDLAIGEWRAAGLNVASSIRIHKLTVLAKNDIVRSLGTLPESDQASLAGLLCRAFCPEPRRVGR
jgi:mRNA-degrading endonuclease toxin of MazEF toxin-antitoxin module